MAVVLDAGALIAYDRGNRTVRALLDDAHRGRVPVRTSTAAVAQAWRHGSRQVRLGRLLRGVDERVLDQLACRRVGVLLGTAGLADVVDGAIIDVAVDGDEVLTSDPDDLVTLAGAAGTRVAIITVSA